LRNSVRGTTLKRIEEEGKKNTLDFILYTQSIETKWDSSFRVEKFSATSLITAHKLRWELSIYRLTLGKEMIYIYIVPTSSSSLSIRI